MTDPTTILHLIDAFRHSKTMFTAVKLGVFDRLAGEPQSAKSLAGRLSVDGDALERLLHACVALGLLEQQDGVFRNSAAADVYLRHSSPQSLVGYILYSNDVLFPMWSHLEDAVREGSHRWQQTFHTDGPLWDQFFRTQEAMRTFVMGMHGFGVMGSPAVARAFDLSGFRTLADLGGATGHLTIAACEAWPQLRGIVFDLETVIPVAREQVALSAARDRIECVAGDFFRDALPTADLFALGRILHDWSPANIQRLLTRIYEALPPGGALLIAEKIMDEDKSGPLPANMQSLNMLVVTEGKERTLGEYEALLRGVGFENVVGVRTGKPIDAIMARKLR